MFSTKGYAMHKRLLRPDRLRQVPKQFSWIDHRLVREHHLERCTVEGCALYLFLLTVADAQGLSYYSERSLAARLPLDVEGVRRAGLDLIAAGLIAFDAPLYQVLALERE
jgi:hypothetical protein